MTFSNYQDRAELFLGSDEASALAQGPRAFSSPAKALKFAFEHAAPVSLRGAKLRVGETTFSGEALLELYRGQKFPRTVDKTVRQRIARRGRFKTARHARPN